MSAFDTALVIFSVLCLSFAAYQELALKRANKLVQLFDDHSRFLLDENGRLNDEADKLFEDYIALWAVLTTIEPWRTWAIEANEVQP